MDQRNTGLVFLVLALALVLPATSDVTSSYVTLTRDGYQNVVVSIEENAGFASCQEGLDTVKEMIRSTSKSFAQALVRPAYFGNVTIIFPDSWAADPLCGSLLTSANVSDLPWARSHRADIRITPDHPVFGWQPHSFQYGRCQQSGLPINVPSSFVTSDTVLAKGLRMAREWAHYRYGVFDEGGMPSDQRHPSGYLTYQTESSDKIMRPNTCSDLKTPSGSWSSGNCQSTTTANSTCEFVADVYNPDIRSSLMYRPDLDHMEKFCTKENHDDSVPSKLSYHCGRLSASEVIYKHSDFTPGVTPANTSADITFNVIQNPFSGYHVVLDMASFKDVQTFEIARSSLIQFVGFLLDPIWLSIDVHNGDNVTELQPPVVLDSVIQEAVLASIIGLQYVGSSSDKFGDALSRAQSRAYSGQDVIILTAAQTLSSLSTWVTSYQDHKVNAHLVYFGVSTTKVLDIAQLTRYGSSNFMPNVINNRVQSAYSWAVNTLQSIYGKTRTHRAKLFEQSVIQSSPSDINKTGSFYLDSSASRLLVSLYCLDANNNALNIDSFSLIQPNGLRIQATDYVIDYGNLYTFTLVSALEPFPEGLWRFEILFQKTLDRLSDKRLDIWAESANSSQIQLRTWNSALDNQPLDFTKAPVGLYAQLTQNGKPIRGANVTAFVYAGDSAGSTSSLLAEIPLMDEGISDVTSGDGIYSGFMIKPSNSSLSYSVYYWAYGVNSLAEVDNGVYSRQPTTGSVIPMSDPVPAAIQFNRFEYGPSFQLTTVPTNGFDLIPPQRITDLAILSYDSSSRTAVLGWTASKDNYGTGDFVTYYLLERSIGTRETVTTNYQSLVIVDGSVNVTVQVPSVNDGEYVKYRVQGRDSSLNYGEVSNVVSLAGPAPPSGGLSTAGMWAIIGTFIALVVIILIIVLVRCCCPVEAKRRKRQAQRKIRNLFSSNDTATRRAEETPVTRYQSPPPAVQQWTSSDMNRDGGGDPPAVRRESDSSTSSSDKVRQQQQPQVEVRQKKANPAPGSIQGSERIYFGREDIDRMTTGQRSETYSERGTEEMIKRAPSMDLQLATILRLNSSNLSIERAGLEDNYDESDGASKPRVYQRPYKPNPVSSRPVSSQVTSKGFSYIHGPNNKPLSQSETNLYYTDVTLRPPAGPSTKSSPTNSYLSVFAEQRADMVPQPQPSSAQSSLASTLRAGLRSNEEWRDSNSFIYTDPRFDGQSNGQSSFDPQLHPANQVGLPPALPTVPPPHLPRMYNSDAGYADDHRSSHMSMDQYGADPQRMSRSSSKPSLVSAV